MRPFMLLMILITTQVQSQESDQQSDTKQHTEEQRQSMQMIVDAMKSVFLIGVDDPLDPEVSELLQHGNEVALEDNAYIYLWGADIQTEDPYETGLKRYQQMRAADAAYLAGGLSYNDEAFDEMPLLDFSFVNPNLKCSYHEVGCLERRMSALKDTDQLTPDDTIILERYHRFFQFSRNESMALQTFHSPFAPYRVLYMGQAIHHFKLFKTLLNGHKDAFIQAIATDMKHIKMRMSEEHSLIGKMVLTSMLQANLDLLSYLIQKDFIPNDHVLYGGILAPLTATELNIRPTLLGEFRFGINFLLHMGQTPESLLEQPLPEHRKPFFNFLAKLVLKANMSANALYHDAAAPMLSISFIDPVKFLQDYQNLKITHRTNYIRNPVGSYLSNQGLNLKKIHLVYQARMHHTNMKIQMLRAYLEQGSFEQVVEQAEQGHSEYLNHMDLTPPHIQGDEVCYQDHLDVRDDRRCLRIYAKEGQE